MYDLLVVRMALNNFDGQSYACIIYLPILNCKYQHSTQIPAKQTTILFLF